MLVCLVIEGQENVTWRQWVDLAGACETHGFDGLFRSDHYLPFRRPAGWGATDAWSTITALGAVTQRIRLGSLVSPIGFRHPSQLAKVVVTADHVSSGRVELDSERVGWTWTSGVRLPVRIVDRALLGARRVHRGGASALGPVRGPGDVPGRSLSARRL